jgi:succinoglycan biosynthesis transport protein ExoP
MAEKELEKPKINIAKYFKVVWKRRWLIAITAILTGLITLIVSFLVRPMFKSSTTIVLITEQTGLLSSPAVLSLMSMANLGNPTTTDTELEIMTSTAVTTEVVKKLNLQVDRYYIPRDSNGRPLVSDIIVEQTAKPNRYYIEFTSDEDYKLVDANNNYYGSGAVGEDFRAAGLSFLVFPANWEEGRRIQFDVSSLDASAKNLKENAISIKEQANYMLEITATADDGLKAKRTAEEIINQYINVTNSFKKSVAHETKLLLEDRLFEIKRKRDMAEQNLVDYQQSHNTVFLGSRADALANQIGVLQTERIQAEIQAEAIRRSMQTTSKNPEEMKVYMPITPSTTEGTSSATSTDPVITELENQVDQLRLRLDSYRSRYTEKHPLVVETEESLRSAENVLYSRIRQKLDPYLNSYESQLSAIYGEFDNMVKTLPPDQMEMAHIARDVEEYSAILSALQAQYEQALIQETQEQSQARRVRIVSPSTVPDTPSYPRKKMNALFGALAGLVLGVVFAFIVEFTTLVDAMGRTRLGKWWQNRFSRRRPR